VKIKPVYRIMGIVLGSALLFSLGGTIAKALRRFVLPLFLASGGVWLGQSWIKALIAIPLMIGALCLGYGENTALFMRILTILAMGISLLPMANKRNAWLCLLVPATFGLGYYASLNLNYFNWTIVELATGGAYGAVTVMLALSRRR
jgi:hypothetical protein